MNIIERQIENQKLQETKNSLAVALKRDLPLKEILTLISLLGFNILEKYHVKKQYLPIGTFYHVRRRFFFFFSVRISMNYALEIEAYKRLVEISDIEKHLL